MNSFFESAVTLVVRCQTLGCELGNPLAMKHALENKPLILVTGQARSGTTVLTKAIAKHPLVHSNEVESNVLYDVLWAANRGFTMPDRRSQMVVEEAEYHLTFRRALLHLLWPERNCPPATSCAAISTFSSIRPDAADYFGRVFPNALIVDIVRNGIEVVASRMVHPQIGKHTFEEHCVAWAHAKDMVQWGRERPKFFLVRHEQLRDRQRTTAIFDQLFSTAGLSSHAACGALVAGRPIHVTQYPGESKESQQDLTTRINRWQQWSAEQRETFQKLCADAMDYFEYEIPWL